MGQLSAVDTDALTNIFTTHRPVFIRMAAKIVGSYSQAEDIVHDAFVKIIPNCHKYDVDSHVSYMMRIVRNLAIDHYRRKFIERRVLDGSKEGAALVAGAAQPDSINMHRQTLRVVASALEELPKRMRYAFEASRIHGVRQKDIAATLGVSPTLVNFMIRDALIHCRRRVEAEAA
jgi:RNA polymerase sigma factor (sigma-70 family)